MRPTLITSLGNPAPRYSNTLHSAGHVVLRELIRCAGGQPPIPMKSRKWVSAPVSKLHDPRILFWESPNYMNISGPALASAWNKFKTECTVNTPRSEAMLKPKLVILHDDMELEIGQFKLRENTVGASARGHNGLKSVLKQSGMRKEGITRVGVGIGPRPHSRQPEDVAEFVLRTMSTQETEKIRGIADVIWQLLIKPTG